MILLVSGLVLFAILLAADTIKFKLTKDFAIDGKTARSITEGTADAKVEANPAAGIPIAKIGNLTTRTSNTVGTLTMAAGHGIVDADRLDIYWTNPDGTQGHRRGVVVGTVVTNSVPFSLGAGDNLPTLISGTYPITAAVPGSEVFVITGDNVTAFRAKSDSIGLIVVCQADNTEIAKYLMDGTNMQSWLSTDGVTNPFAGVTAGKVFFSQAETDGVGEMSATALRN